MSSTKYGVRWHSERRKQLLERYPEARTLMGPNPWTALVVVALVALEVGLAVAFSALPWWAIVLLSYVVGAFIAHALGVLIHDAAHDLIFRKPWANKLIAIFANLPLIFPAAIDFRESNRKIALPTLVIAGARDEATPPAMSQEMVAAIPGAKLAAVEAAHLSAVERPAEFAQVLKDFFATL